MKKALFTLGLGVFLVGQTAFAVTSPEDLAAQIQKLQAQLQEMQKKVPAPSSAAKVTAPMASEKAREVASPNASFNRDLYYGMKGDADVYNLQEFLISKGYLSGSPTGNYFLMTVAAVKKFQAANGVNATGYFGPKARAIMNEMVKNEIGAICYSEDCDSVIEKPIVGEEKFYIEPWNVEMRQGGQVNIAAYVKSDPVNCANCGAGVPQKVAAQWHVSDGSIATVAVNSNNVDAVLYGVRAGRATVTAVYTNSAGKSVKANIAVKVLGDGSPLTVLHPNGGETWTKGSVQTIKWSDSSAAAPAHDIQLVPYEQPCTGDVCILGFPAPYSLAKGVSGTSYEWSVGTVMDARTVMDGAFTIQVCRTGTSQCDSSNSYFKISGGITNTPKPSIYLAASGGGKTGESVSVNLGESIKISGTPQNLQNLSYWKGTGTPPAGYYSAAWFFDQEFANNNSCGVPESFAMDPWNLICSAKRPGSSYFYIQIYTNGGTYTSNKVSVSIANTSAPSGVLSIMPFESRIKAGESVSLSAYYTPSLPFCPNCGAPVPVPVNPSWSVSDPNIISVSNGVVKGLAAGDAKVYADYTLSLGEVVKAGAYVHVEARVVVDPVLPPFSLSAVESVSTGNTFSVYWSNAANTTPKDWIAIAPRGATWTSGYSWVYTGGTVSGAKDLTAPSAPGSYDVIYYKDNGYTEVKRIPITVLGNVSTPIIPPTTQTSNDAELASMLSIAQAWLDELSKSVR